MPELPEVETVRRGLERLIVGQRVVSLDLVFPGSFAAAPPCSADGLAGHRITGIERRGKLLVLSLDGGWVLAVHLKMTGQLVFVAGDGGRFGAGHPSDSLVDRLPDRSTRLVFELEGGRLFFNDQRKFGRVQLLPAAELDSLPFCASLGPDALDPGFGAADFAVRLRKKAGSPVKAALLDQTVLAGVGNIYADEALWEAAVHPETRVRVLGDDHIARLREAVRAVMELSLEHGGSTDRNYVDAEGRRGAYLGFAKVFRRQGQPCARCGTPIIKTRVAGRGTHWCPQCQIKDST